MTARQSVFFQGWSIGEIGVAPSWEVGYRLFRGRPLYRGVFTGRNVMRYIGGALGPRHEFATATVTSAPASPTLKAVGVNNANGTGLFWALSDAAAALTVYQSGGLTTPITLTAIGTLAVYTGGTLPLNYASLLLGTVTYLASSVDKVYKIDHLAPSVAAVAGSPKGRAICQYGDRTIVAGPDTLGITPHANQNRLYYSAPNDPSDWSGTWSGGPGAALNYIDIGNASSPIVGVYPLRDQLAVVKGDGTWWVITGVPGVNDTLRRVFNATAPASASAAATIAGGDAVAFLESISTSAGTLVVPGQFNGSAVTYRRDLAQTFATGPPGQAFPLRRPGDWMYFGGGAGSVIRESFEATTGWSVVSGAAVFTVSADFKEGAGALQAVMTGVTTIQKTEGPWDFTGIDTFTVWVRSTGLGAIDYSIQLQTSPGNYYIQALRSVHGTFAPTTTWKKHTMPRSAFTAVGSPSWSNITALQFSASGGTFVFDDLETSVPPTFGIFRDGAWTRHNSALSGVSQLAGYDPVRDVLAVPKTDLSAVYVVQPYTDAANASDGVLYSNDPPPAADVTFTLPEFIPFGGVEVSLRGVYVDFIAFDSLPAGNNTFDVICIPRRPLGGTADPATQTLSYSEAQPVGQLKERRFFGFAEAFGGGWQLQFSNIRGVAFDRVVAVYDERERQAA